LANPKTETRLWLWQRASAVVLALAVSVHLATMIYAVRGGISGAEIIGRVSGNGYWLAFYSVFVSAIAVHAPIGIRTILNEATNLTPRAVHAAMATASLIILTMGFRAVIALYTAGPS